MSTFMPTYTQRYKDTDGQTDRQTDTDTEIGRQKKNLEKGKRNLCGSCLLMGRVLYRSPLDSHSF